MLLSRREAVLGGGGALLLTALPAQAEAAYPSRTIKMIVPCPAGGTTDFLGRLVAEQLKNGLGATVIVENKPGGVPLKLLDVKETAAARFDGSGLVLSRPDQHVAWRGNGLPANSLLLIDRVRGAA